MAIVRNACNKWIIWVFIALLAPVMSKSQVYPLDEKRYADSLLNIVNTSANDSVRAKGYFLLSHYFSSKDTVESKHYLVKGKALARQFPMLRALSNYYDGMYYFNHDVGKSIKAYQKAEKALARFKTPEAYEFRSKCWFNLAAVQGPEKGDEFAIDIVLNKAIPLAKKAGKTELLAHNYTSIGGMFMNNHQFDKSEQYFKMSLKILDKKKDSQNVLMNYLSLIDLYLRQKNHDAAKKMLDKSGKLLLPHSESTFYPEYYAMECSYYTVTENFEKALESAEKGLISSKKYHDDYQVQLFTIRKMNIYIGLKRFREVRDLLMSLPDDSKLMKPDRNRKMKYKQLAIASAGLGDTKEAYRWQLKYSALSDSMYEANIKERINDLELRYQKKENQNKIAELENKNKIALLSAKNNRLISWLLGVTCLSLLILAILGWFNYRKGKKLALQQAINFRQQTREHDQQKRLVATRSMLEGEEQERKRIARDLHDGLGGTLAGISMSLSALSSSSAQSTIKKDELEDINNRVDGSLQELRRIAHNMMPEMLLRMGLETAVRDLCESYTTPDLSISFQSFDLDQSITADKQLTLYRIIQELLLNAVRHARATQILVQCSQNGRTLFITIEDDGRGFNKAEQDTIKKGIGLSNVKTRVEYLQGNLEIIPVVDEGTAVHIEVEC